MPPHIRIPRTFWWPHHPRECDPRCEPHHWLNWQGVDWHWLRTTPPGAGILFVLSTWPLFVIPFVGQATSTLLGEIWVVTLYILWAWEGYWATTRPLPRRGLLGWRKAR